MRLGVIDRHRPVVAGDVPVELVVVFEITDAVANGVADFDGARSVFGVRNVDFQVAETAGGFGFILQLLSGSVGDRGDIKKERVVRPPGAWILDRNSAVDAVPLADENEADPLLHHRRTIFTDEDGVRKVGNSPTLCGERNGQRREANQNEKFESQGSRPKPRSGERM